MGAIAGMLDLSGAPIDADALHRMSLAMAHRGRDRCEEWRDGSIGVVIRAFHTTPESARERQPVHSRDGSLVLVCHARIDNRDELIRELGIAGDREVPTDADLILAAYDRWQRRMPAYLAGCFALAIWDRRRRELFCCRDHIGINPLFYRADGRQFLWASTISALLRGSRCDRRLNHSTLLTTLAGFEGTDPTRTFYDDIFKLPPANSLRVTASGQMITERYWDPPPVDDHATNDFVPYVDRFSQLFDEVVATHLRSITPVGVWLSGGIDSGATAATAEKIYAEHPESGRHIVPISAVFDTFPSTDERTFIQDLVGRYDLTWRPVCADAMVSFSSSVHADADEPLGGTFAEVQCAQMAEARAAGLRAVITGDGGDLVLEGNFFFLADLFFTGRWTTVFRTLRQFKHPSHVFAEWVLRPWARQVYRRTIRSRVIRSPRYARNAIPAWLHADRRAFIRALLQDERHFAPLGRLASETDREKLQTPVVPDRTVWLQDISLSHDVEIRFPYYDIRLVDFLMRVPTHHKTAGGIPKAILRAAMKGRVPDRTRLTIDDRGNFSGLLDAGIRALLVREGPAWLSDGVLAGMRFVDPSGIQRLVSRHAHDGSDRFTLGRIIQMEQWLRNTMR
jgi:asparagine synthase (glutamine-hydrolysing)